MNGAGFIVDLHRCVGCGACVLACRIENGRVTGKSWRRVLPLNLRRSPGGPTYFFSVACNHCDNPACLNGCPSRAYEKRADGVVLHREDRCLGCRYCEMACPFGAPAFDHHLGVVSKCHLCAHRLDRALQPACVAACPTSALALGRPDRDRTGEIEGAPGFVDPAACHPNLSFRPPKGAKRAVRFQNLLEADKR